MIYERAHGLIQTIRGMCTDERPWEEIDQKLRELDDLVYESRLRASKTMTDESETD